MPSSFRLRYGSTFTCTATFILTCASQCTTLQLQSVPNGAVFFVGQGSESSLSTRLTAAVVVGMGQHSKCYFRASVSCQACAKF